MRRSDDPALDLTAMASAIGLGRADGAPPDPERLDEFDDAQEFWVARLAPLTDAAPPFAPSSSLWARIEASTAAAPLPAATVLSPMEMTGIAETATGARGPAAASDATATTLPSRTTVPPGRPAGSTAEAASTRASTGSSTRASTRRQAEQGFARRFWDWLGLGPLATVTATTAAFLALAALDARRPTDTPALIAVLQSPDDAARAGFLIEVAGDGAIRVVPLGTTPVPSGRALEFWTKADGEPGPTSLGLVAGDDPTRTTFPAGLPGPGQLFEVSLEPATGSPVGRPTGPVLYIGRALLGAGGV